MPAGPAIVVLILCGTTAGVLGGVRVADAAALTLALASLALMVGRTTARRLLMVAAIGGIALLDGAWACQKALSSPLLAWIAAAEADERAGDATNVHGVLREDASVIETGVRLIIDVDRLRTAAGWLSIRGRVQAHLTGRDAMAAAPAWTAGRAVTVPMVLRQPQTWRNPGSASLRWQRLRRTTDLVGTIKSASLVEVQRGPLWDEAAARVRRHVRWACDQYLVPRSAQSAAIVAAILIGDRAGLALDVQRRLRTAGTFHVIAISGGNVALLSVMCFAMLSLVIRSFRTLAIVTVVLVICYGWLVGGDPSVRRAVAAAALYLLLSLAGLKPRAINVLATVAGMLALADPLIVIDVGAWLSFGATLGIVLCASRFVRWARPPAPAQRTRQAMPTEPRSVAAARTLWQAALTLFSATLAAEVILLPIAAAVFSRVSIFGLVLNFIAIPAMAVVQIAGFVMVAFAGWSNRGAALAGQVSAAAASLLVGSSTVVDSAPWLSWRVPPVSLWWILAFYAGYAVFLRHDTWGLPRCLAAASAGLSLVVIVTSPTVEMAGPSGGKLRVTMIDVGQGDSILVQFPQGQSLLIDAGGARGSADFGTRVVTPALWALGVRRLDWLAVTHGDIDHAGGALDIAHDFHPREIWEGVPVPNNPELRALRIDAHAQHIVWRQVLAGHSFEVGSVKVEVLHPPLPDWERQRVRNDDSLVMRLGFGDVEMLLTGDAGREFEDTVPSDRLPAPLRLLKIGHHGSRTSSTEGFIRGFGPEVAFVSAGRGNMFGHPAPDVIARLERLGVNVFRTDRDGAIVIETDGAEVEVKTMTGRSWRFVVRRE